MPATVVLGTQWGDEGKGKAVDYLADRMDFVVRYQGGNNAGHTIIAEGRLLKLQLIPSGILYPHLTSVIADGVVVDPAVLLREKDLLDEAGVNTDGLRVSLNAHLIMPYHLELEKVTQRFLGKNALGTTKRGIGPAYADRAARVGIRVQDLYDEKILREKLDVVLWEKNQVLTKVYNRLAIAPEQIVEDYLGYAERLRPYVADTGRLLHDGLAAGKHVMLEGAQGTMLDLDHGTYPFVTSSTPVAGYALASAGIGPSYVDRVIGITKAYVTRVGSGPFPTEDTGADGERIGERGHEFGTVTGRKRRCGWFDAIVLRYAARLNGLTEICLTKLDVLSGFETLRVCVGYRAGGATWDDVPPNQTLFHEAEPVWEELPGWSEDLADARAFDDLPKEAQGYVRFLEEVGGIPVSLIGVGPAREQTVAVDRP
jgi:adenylosuccinate synthase